MTNGEKIKEIFPQAEIIPQFISDIGLIGYDVCIDEETYFSKEWWNMEYQEPNKSENPNSSTTKNDLGVDKTFYEQIVEYCNEHFLVLVEKDVWEDARKALTTKNDLVVDCISRADAIRAMQDKAKKLKNEDTINGLCGAVAILYEMPPVTPKGHWIRVTDKAGHLVWECDKCGWQQRFNTNYCPDCSAKNDVLIHGK